MQKKMCLVGGIARIAVLSVVVLCVGVALVTAAGSTESSGERVRIAFGGAPATSSAYVVAVAYGDIINGQVEGIDITIEETGGGVDNVKMIQSGELQGGVANSVASYSAYRGINAFEGQEPFENLRSWVPQYTWPIQMVVPADSPAQTIYDLIGKKIGVDIVGRGAEVSNRDMLTSLGLSYDDIDNYHVSMTESLDLLRTGDLDATFIGTGAPTAIIVEYGTTQDFRLISLSEEDVNKVANDYPYYFPIVIPAGTYDDLTEDVLTVGGYTNAFVHKDLPEDAVYEMTKAVWENRDRLEEAHPSQRRLSGDMVPYLDATVPLHPGAARYYREVGFID